MTYNCANIYPNTDASKPSLVKKNFLSHEVTTNFPEQGESVKHREKIMLLKAKDCNELSEVIIIPAKQLRRYFVIDNSVRFIHNFSRSQS